MSVEYRRTRPVIVLHAGVGGVDYCGIVRVVVRDCIDRQSHAAAIEMPVVITEKRLISRRRNGPSGEKRPGCESLRSQRCHTCARTRGIVQVESITQRCYRRAWPEYLRLQAGSGTQNN